MKRKPPYHPARDLILTVKPQSHSGHSLLVPMSCAMVRTIHEHPSYMGFYRFEGNGIHLLELDASIATFEYAY